jgi:hypothetical protein
MALTQVSRGLLSTSIVDNGNATAITIDSSENVLVGTDQTPATLITTSTTSHEGVGIADGYLAIARNLTGSEGSGGVAFLNRLATDGPILDLRKDGTSVGSIGVEGGDSLYIQAGTTSGAGLHMHPTGGTVRPARNGATIDNTIDLGTSTRRFKDLYLSGGAYLGGTAAANKLDHYEETTWTPTQSGVTLSVSVARAIRIGNLVTLACRLTFPSTSDGTQVGISGLPFTRDTNWQSAGAVMASYVDLPSGYTQLNYFLGGTTIQLYAGGDDVGWTSLVNSDLSGGHVILNVTYQTNA